MNTCSILLGSALVWALPSQALDPGLDPEKSIQQYVLESWNAEDGAPAHPIRDLLRTSDGFLWLGTRGGLSRSDGITFEHFDHRNTASLEIEDISALAEGPDGVLWIGTLGGGFLSYREGVFEAFGTGDSAGDVVQALAFDARGTLWLATRGGLFVKRGKQVVRVRGDQISTEERFSALHLDKEGRLWAATESARIFLQSGEETRLITSLPVSVPITCLQIDRTGDLWAGTEGRGIWRLHGEQWTRLPLPEELRWQAVWDLLEDRSGHLWFVTDGGLYRLKGGELEVYQGVDDRRYRSLFEDHEGCLWIGAYQGLLRLQDSFIVPFGATEGFRHEHARSVYQDRRGRIWVGTLGGGLHEIGAGRARALGKEEGLPSDFIWSILQTREGIFWLGADEGLIRAQKLEVDGTQAHLYGVEDGLPPFPIRVVIEDPAEAGVLWLGTDGGGFLRWSDGVTARYGVDEGLAHEDVRWILPASSAAGDLWIGTQLGLYRLREGQLSRSPLNQDLKSTFIVGASVDEEGTLWMGTLGGGLSRLAEGRITNYSSRDGLPSNDAWWILEAKGDLWWGNDQGIVRVSKSDLSAFDQGLLEEIPSRFFGRSDGMRSTEINGGGYPAGLKDDLGQLWFPSMAGVVRLDPAELESRPKPPPVLIQSLLLDGVAEDLRASLVQLTPGQANLEIRYTALNLRRANQLRFRYRLLEFDQDWVDAGPRRSAYYSQLPPGTYTFQVEADDQGIRSSQIASLTLQQSPYLWQTLTFRLLGSLLAFAILFAAIQLRLGRVRARNAALKQEIDHRQRAELALARTVEDLETSNSELLSRNEEMERFLYAISHDLVNPLVTIKGFVGLMVHEAEESDRELLQAHAAKVGSAVDTMRRLMRELLEVSRVSWLNEPSQKVDLGRVASEAATMLQARFEEGGIRLELAGKLPTVLGNHRRLLQAFHNLLDNALSFLGGASEPCIRIGLRQLGGENIVVVEDNGIGIASPYHEKVFGLFERLDSAGEGTGIGLALVRRIVDSHGGKIWVESEGIGRGSRFCMVFPDPDDDREAARSEP